MFDLPSAAEQRKLLSFRPIERPLWTKNKAKLIERYLYYFVLVTKHGNYIDGFAGPQSPHNADMWAARLVLNTRPRWLRTVVLCDISGKQVERLEALKAEQEPRQPKEPRRGIYVLSGDFNERVVDALGHVGSREASFCLLDQRTFQCQWATVERIAKHKTDGNKIEIFYFLPVGWLARAASGLKRPSALREWWGRDDWQKLTRLRALQLAELTVARFLNELGYQYCFPWPIFERKSGGRILYFMIHASDHPLAPGLMRRAYTKALDQPEPPDQLEFLATLTGAPKSDEFEYDSPSNDT